MSAAGGCVSDLFEQYIYYDHLSNKVAFVFFQERSEGCSIWTKYSASFMPWYRVQM